LKVIYENIADFSVQIQAAFAFLAGGSLAGLGTQMVNAWYLLVDWK
jgi:hypothetical protein